MHRFFLCVFALCTCCIPKNDDKPFDYGIVVGRVKDKSLYESSGLASSIKNPGLLWTHNDSGDKPRLFLVDTLGRMRTTLWLVNAGHKDWEDIAIGSGPEDDESYLYVGDVGDNRVKRAHKTIYRLPEPASYDAPSTSIEKFDSIRFVLEGQQKDTEAMIVDPLTKNIYLFSKRGRSTVYKLSYPQMTQGVDTARIVGRLPFTTVTAADISTSGKEVLIKTYSAVYYWKRVGDQLIEELLQSKHLALPYEPEEQGEAITFKYDGSGYYTSTEVAKGENVPLRFYPRKKESESVK